MGKATIATNTEKALAFLVESGALYLCIWVHIVSSLISTGSAHISATYYLLMLVGRIHHCDFDGLEG